MYGERTFIDITGQRFGQLVAIRRAAAAYYRYVVKAKLAPSSFHLE